VTYKLGLRKTIFFGIASFGFTLLIFSLITEVLLRLLGIGYGSSMAMQDPIAHHIYQPNITFVKYDPRGIFKGAYKVKIDSEGFIVNPEITSVDCQLKQNRIAFMGDSFVAGHYRSYSASLVGQLEGFAREGVCVRNFGVSSYSPVLHWVLWHYKVKKINPSHVFLLLYSNDIRNDLLYSSRAIKGDDGLITAVPGASNPWLIKIARHSYFLRFLRKCMLRLQYKLKIGPFSYLKDKDIFRLRGVNGIVEENPDLTDLSTRYVRLLAKEVQKNGARLVLSAVPSKVRMRSSDPKKFRDLEFSDKWKKWAHEEGIEFLDLVPIFQQAAKNGQQLFLNGDPHFAQEGINRTVKKIAEYSPELFYPYQ